MEVWPGQSSLQVGDGGTTTLGIVVVVDGVAKHFVFVCRYRIDFDFGIAVAIDKPILGRRVARLLIEDVILRSDVAGRLSLIETVDGRHEISMLPAGGEVVVKIGCRWLKEQTGIDGTGATDGATNEGVDLSRATGQIGGSGKDGVVEPRYVDTSQVGTCQPLWSFGTSSDAVGWTTSLEKKDLFTGFTHPGGRDDTGGTGTDYDYIPYSGRPCLRLNGSGND